MVNTTILPLSIRERIPSDSKRYDDKHAGYPKKRTIPLAGRLNLLGGDDEAAHPYGPVPTGWAELTNPSEGQPFFYNSAQR
ncbi:hypothetical protein FRC07_011487, partial [Ceratobasidium sp. 392]